MIAYPARKGGNKAMPSNFGFVIVIPAFIRPIKKIPSRSPAYTLQILFLDTILVMK